MKQLIFLFIILTNSIAIHGQAVNIPDEEFLKALIKLGVDTNGDEMIQIDEAEAVDTLSLGNGVISWGKISSMEGISAFKNLTYLFCYSDSLTTLDLSSNTLLSFLHCGGNKLTNLDLSSNVNLISLDYSNNDINTIDLSSNGLLQFLNCRSNNVSTLDLSQVPKLTFLDCAFNDLTSLDLKLVPLLSRLYCHFNDIETLDVNSTPFLNTIYCNDNQLKSLDFSSNSELTILRCFDNNMTLLDLSTTPLLEFLDCGFNEIAILDLSNVPLLNYLDCRVNDIDTLNLNSVPLLKTLRCKTNGMSDLDLSSVPNLRRLECGWNKFTTLDLSSVPELEILFCHNNFIKSINTTNLDNLKTLKIGGPSFQSINMLDNVNTQIEVYLNLDGLKYLCADSDEIEYFDIFLNLDDVEINEYCPDDSHSVVNVAGAILYSESFDECSDGSPISNDFELDIEYEPGKSFVHYSLGHSYDVNIPANTLSTLRIKNLNLDIFELTPEFHQVSTEVDLTSLDFCISPKGAFVSDLSINVYTLDDPSPGFNHDYIVDYENLGNASSDGVIKFEYDPDIMQVIEASSSWIKHYGKLEMNYSNLSPLEKRTNKITFSLNSPMDSIPLERGDNLLISCSLTPQEDDIDLQNNNVFLSETIVNSFDPNDKSCLQGDIIFQDSLHKPLTYRIRFENKGTAPARNINILDVLDSSIFDPNSIEILNSSHSLDLSIRENIIEFNFFDINLAFENGLNEGYIIFTINVIDGIDVGDIIENEASIYFDFNWPIHTNVATSEVVEDSDGDGFHNLDDCDDSNPEINPNAEEIPNNEIDEDCDGEALITSIKELEKSIKRIYPNPTIDLINIDIEAEITYKSTIYNIQGEILHVSTNVNSIQIHNVPAGVYFLEIQDRSTGQKILKKIVKGNYY